MGHNINGGSRLERRLLCPGSANAERGLPDTDTKYSLLGSAEHLVASMANEGMESASYWLNKDVEIEDAEGIAVQIRMDQTSIEAIQVYADYIKQRRKEIDEVKPAEFEQRVDPGPWWGDRDDTAGTADAILYGRKITEIIDYKGGAGVPVEVEDNKQGISYATGVACAMDWSHADPEHIIRITIVQPKCPHPAGPVRSWDIYPGDLYRIAEQYTEDLAKTDDPNAPRIPGEKQCRFCKAKGTCPELAQESLSVFSPQPEAVPVSAPAAEPRKDNGGGEPVPQTQSDWDDLESALLRPVDMLSVDQIAQILDKAPLMRSWLDGVSKKGLELAQSGQSIPRHKVVRAKTQRKYAEDDKEIIKKLCSMNNSSTGKKIAKADVMQVKVIPITKAEKLVKPVVSERTWRNFEKKYIVKPEGKPTLVPDTDPRESIAASDVFTPQEQPAVPVDFWE